MLAVFGMGPLELLLIGMMCLGMIGVPVIVIAVVLWVNRTNRDDDKR